MNILLNIIIAALIISISGCSTSRESDPLLIDDFSPTGFWSSASYNLGLKYSGVNSLSTTASRRIAILKQDPGTNKVTLCSEPSPDVAEAYISALSNAIKAEGSEPKSGITANVSNDYAKAIATQVVPLVFRTQGLQAYRDATHDLCVDRMSGLYDGLPPRRLPFPVITTSTETTTTSENLTKTHQVVTRSTSNEPQTIDVNNYNEMKYFYFINAMETINNEVPLMLDAQKEYFKNIKAGVPASTITEISNAIKGAGSTTVTTSTPSSTTTTTAPNATNPPKE